MLLRPHKGRQPNEASNSTPYKALIIIALETNSVMRVWRGTKIRNPCYLRRDTGNMTTEDIGKRTPAEQTKCTILTEVEKPQQNNPFSLTRSSTGRRSPRCSASAARSGATRSSQLPPRALLGSRRWSATAQSACSPYASSDPCSPRGSALGCSFLEFPAHKSKAF